VNLRWVKKYGNFIKYHIIFNKPAIMVTNTKMIQKIVSTYDFPKPEQLVSNLKPTIGEGLFFAEGETHKRQRKMMNPAFSHNNIKVRIYIIFFFLFVVKFRNFCGSFLSHL